MVNKPKVQKNTLEIKVEEYQTQIVNNWLSEVQKEETAKIENEQSQRANNQRLKFVPVEKVYMQNVFRDEPKIGNNY